MPAGTSVTICFKLCYLILLQLDIDLHAVRRCLISISDEIHKHILFSAKKRLSIGHQFGIPQPVTKIQKMWGRDA